MRSGKILVSCLSVLWTVMACSSGGETIRVGVFEGFGGAQTCIWETVKAVSLDEDMTVRTVTSADLAAGALDRLDALVIPGGGGSRQYFNMGDANIARIRRFVENGGGLVGICAGAYLLSDTPDYTCTGMSGARAIDIEHDNRGHGIAKFTLSEAGKALFPEVAAADTLFVMYYEGPVLVPSNPGEPAYEVFATMESDVHEEGDAPAGMTDGKPFFIGTPYGKGRVFSSIAHPEATPGMMWMVPRMVRWTLDLPVATYSSAVVNPDVFGREILMSREDLDFEASCFKVLLYGTPEEKIARLDWLQAHHSWDAKRWIQGMVYDADPAVRVRAARYIADIHYLPYLLDVSAACEGEADPAVRAQLVQCRDRLRSLLP